MGNSRSFRLFSVFGIRVGVDFSWFVVLFLAIFWLSGTFKVILGGSDTVSYATAVATALLFFASLLLHELGHALIARRNGIAVPSIDLWMLGGMARLDREAESPGEEFRIAAAGPAVSLLIAAACLGIGAAIEGPQAAWNVARLSVDSRTTPVLLALDFLATMNLIIFVFNLLPAWPLDGGRIARSIAWKVTGSKTRATVFSANLGRGLGWILAGVGIWQIIGGNLSGLWWLMLSFFIGSAAKGALVQTQVHHALGDRKVVDLMDRHPVTIPDSIDVVRADDEWFRRYGWSWFAVVDDGGRFVGIAREEQVREAAERPGLGEPLRIADVMSREETLDWRIPETEPVESLLSNGSLARNGALIAVDEEGVLRGVINVEQVRAAIRPRAG